MSKKLIIFSILFLSIGLSNLCYAQSLPVINKTKQTFNVYMDGDDVPLTFGYETANTSSKKMICFSSMTADVDNNPHKCMLGAYYSTDDISIAYLGIEGDFVQLKFIGSDKGDVIFYVEKKMVKFQ